MCSAGKKAGIESCNGAALVLIKVASEGFVEWHCREQKGTRKESRQEREVRVPEKGHSKDGITIY